MLGLTLGLGLAVPALLGAPSAAPTGPVADESSTDTTTVLSNGGGSETEPETVPDAQAVGVGGAAGAPLRAGVYSGQLEVTQDLANVLEVADESLLLGKRFDANLSLGADCDGPESVCTATHDSYSLLAPGLPVERDWRWTSSEPDSTTAVFTTTVEDDCVDEAGAVIGDFTSTITETIVLRAPRTAVTGERVWTEASIVYEEDAFSDDDEVGCHTSAYRAEGILRRTP